MTLTAIVLVALSGGAFTSDLVISRAGGRTELALAGRHAFHSTTAQVSGARLVPVDGTSILLVTWNEHQRGRSSPFYAISLSGGEFQAVRQTSYELNLRYATFDPLVRQPRVPEATTASTSNEFYIVQFITQPLPEFRSAIEACGGTVYNYISQHAYICRLPADALSRVRNLAFVRWVGAYHPAYRFEPDLTKSRKGAHRYYVQICGDDLTLKQLVGAAIASVGGVVEDNPTEGTVMLVRLTPEQVVAASHVNGVLWMDAWSQPSDDMDNVRAVSGANYVQTVGNYQGQGVRMNLIDSGLRATHVDFAGRVTVRNNSGSTSHGTSTCGIIMGNGTANPTGTGMLPQCTLYFGVYSTNWSAGRLTYTLDTVNVYNCVVESNSWGDTQTTAYTTMSSIMDEIIFKTDLLICQSQSNTGNQNSRPQAWAKNIVAVGGIYHYNNSNMADDAWAGGASIGPAADGRIKPDLSFYYDQIYTTSSTSDTSYTSSFGGTSAATPMTAGAFGLFHQMWADGLFQNTVVGTTVFSTRPKCTLAKAWMIARARQYTFSGTAHDLTRTHQGWGTANVQNVYDNRNNTFWVNETDVLTPLQTKTYRLYVPPSTPELKAVMAYNDYWGTTSSTQHRINDLSLKVIAPDGVTTYHGNNGLLAANYSTPGGSPNTKDTVECVFVQNPTSGTWTFEVTAAEINVDGRVETGVIDADYSLVVGGVSWFAPLASYQVTRGTYISGTLADMQTSNNQALVFRSAPRLSTSDPDARLEVTAISPVTSLNEWALKIEGKTTISNATLNAYALNVQTGNYEYLGTFPVGTGDVRIDMTVPSNGSRFINQSTGAITLRLDMLAITLSTSPVIYDTSIDHICVSTIAPTP